MENSLAYITKIKDLRPIKGADKIELAIVRDWQVVVKKGEFRVGDYAVYFEIDSFLPIDERYEFLRKSSYKKMGNYEGFRLRTIKLKNQYSKGLCLPLLIFPEVSDLVKKRFAAHISARTLPTLEELNEYYLSLDLTEILGVKKWLEPIPANVSGDIKSNFPGIIPKTDQKQIQNYFGEYKEKYKEMLFEVSLKLDGCSMTAYYNNGNFGICSRNYELKETDNNSLWKVARRKDLENVLSKLNENVAIQGELIGEGIQRNTENLRGQDFYVFDIYDIDKKRYMTHKEREEFLIRFFEISNAEQLQSVPIIEKEFAIFKEFSDIAELENYAHRPSIFGKEAEGIVCKGFDENNNCISFKVLSNEY